MSEKGPHDTLELKAPQTEVDEGQHVQWNGNGYSRPKRREHPLTLIDKQMYPYERNLPTKQQIEEYAKALFGNKIKKVVDGE